MASNCPAMPEAEFMLTTGATAVGYVNADLLSDNRVELVRRGLYAWTSSLGIELTAVLVEDNSAARPMLRELHDEVRARGARYVVVPDLDHLSTHPLLQGQRVDYIQRDESVTVLPVDAFTTAARLVL